MVKKRITLVDVETVDVELPAAVMTLLTRRKKSITTDYNSDYDTSDGIRTVVVQEWKEFSRYNILCFLWKWNKKENVIHARQCFLCFAIICRLSSTNSAADNEADETDECRNKFFWFRYHVKSVALTVSNFFKFLFLYLNFIYVLTPNLQIWSVGIL